MPKVLLLALYIGTSLCVPHRRSLFDVHQELRGLIPAKHQQNPLDLEHLALRGSKPPVSRRYTVQTDQAPQWTPMEKGDKRAMTMQTKSDSRRSSSADRYGLASEALRKGIGIGLDLRLSSL